jgi:hypothetical protein
MHHQDLDPPPNRLLAVVRDLSFCRTLQDAMGIVRREAREKSQA